MSPKSNREGQKPLKISQQFSFEFLFLSGIAFPDVTEEVEHHLRAFGFQYTAFKLDFVIMPVSHVEYIIAGDHGAALGLKCAEIDLADP